MSGGPEFSRMIDVRQADGRTLTVTADAAERAALARRFGLVRVDRLEAVVSLARDGEVVLATGTLDAQFVQSCAVSAENLPVVAREPIAFRFVPPSAAAHAPDEEIELDANDCDEIEYTGTRFDLGEAVAQSLALAIDPFAVGPEAEEARRRSGIASEGENGPFAALRALKGE